MKTCSVDIGNAYLHGHTTEPYYISAGEEFGELAGLILLIIGSIYGLKTSAGRWHEYLSVTLNSMGFKPSKADPDLRIKDCGTHYEYVAVYVDDLIFVSKDPMKYIEQLKFDYNLKGVGTPEYYLGGNVDIASDGKMTWSAKTYNKNICERIEKLIDMTLRSYGLPLPENYHPKKDDSLLLSEDMARSHQMLVGSANWIFTLGRFDILYAVTMMARFNQVPRQGLLNAMLRVIGYLKGCAKGRILVDTRIPTVAGVPIKQNWKRVIPRFLRVAP